MEIYDLEKLIDYRDHQIRSRKLSKKFGISLPMVLFALDQGESISNESTTFTKMIQVIDGNLTVELADELRHVKKAEWLVIEPNTLHALKAEEKCKFLQIET